MWRSGRNCIFSPLISFRCEDTLRNTSKTFITQSWLGIATAHRYKAWCYHLPLQEDDTQQRRLAEFSKNPINREFSGGKSLNVISQRRRLHVPHWSMSEFRGLKDCVTGLPRLDRDSYWVHSSLGSDKGLRASDESDNGSCPWLCPVVFGFCKGSGRREGKVWKEAFNHCWND